MLLVGISAGSAIAADADEINPLGRPKEFGHGKQTEYALWFEGGMWHIRAAAAKGDKVHFQGFVRVDGGEIVDGSALQMETKLGHRRPGHDWFALDEKKNGFQFIFGNTGGLDGLNFKVSESSKKITFSLLLDSDTSPKHISIGKSAAHPKTNPFNLPPQPDDEHNKLEVKKKKAND